MCIIYVAIQSKDYKNISYNYCYIKTVYTSDDACNARPFFVRPTPPDGQTVTAIVGSELLLRIYAKPTSSSEKFVSV